MNRRTEGTVNVPMGPWHPVTLSGINDRQCTPHTQLGLYGRLHQDIRPLGSVSRMLIVLCNCCLCICGVARFQFAFDELC